MHPPISNAAIHDETSVLIQNFMADLDLIIQENYYIGSEDKWKHRIIYTDLLKAMGRQELLATKYKYLEGNNLERFRQDLPAELAEYLANKTDKALFLRRLRALALKPDLYHQIMSQKDFRRDLAQQNYTDDGLIAGVHNRRFLVISTYPGSSADKAGLQPRDEIIAINDQPVQIQEDENEFTFEHRIWELITATPQKIKYTIKRGGEIYDCYTSFKNEEQSKEEVTLNPKQVSWTLDGDIGIITIKTFSSNNIKEQFAAAYRELVETQGVKKLIIDLRDNQGGFVYEAIAVASFFVKDEYLLAAVRNGVRENVKTLPLEGVQKFDGKVAVIVNVATASAAEIVAAILYHQGHIIIGDRTMGKNIAQRLYVLSDNTVVYMSAYATYVVDRDRLISWESGIIPDYQNVFVEGLVNSLSIAKAKLRD